MEQIQQIPPQTAALVYLLLGQAVPVQIKQHLTKEQVQQVLTMLDSILKESRFRSNDQSPRKIQLLKLQEAVMKQYGIGQELPNSNQLVDSLPPTQRQAVLANEAMHQQRQNQLEAIGNREQIARTRRL